MLKGNMLIAHGGGPTPVINSSLLGAVREAKLHEEIETIYGARFGAEGILAGDLMDLGQFSQEQLDLLAADGMLVKRPILAGEDFVLVGFKPAEWEARFGKSGGNG